MPRGQKPKAYPASMVHEVQARYDAGQTQREIADELGTSQKVIHTLMRNHRIETRVAAKRDQAGSANATWRGDEAGYKALHKRVEAARGRPRKCEECGTEDAARYEWANQTGRYEDVDDYRRLCRSCHARFDGTIRNITG